MPPAFVVRPFTPDNLYEGLSNELMAATVVAAYPRAKYLAAYLATIQAQTIVVENEYTDGDYLDDFASYYVKCFHPYLRRCTRLHFFSTTFDEQRLKQLILDELPEDEAKGIRESYLGFVVARPLPDAIIGRTVLKTYDSDCDRRQYPCARPYDANLFGVKLSVRSLAFQEQDSVLAACATVALWSAFHKLTTMFGTPAPTPVEITRVANQINLPSRPVPSHGLNLQQICNSIRHVGLEPEVVQVGPNTPLVSLIYGHLAMGLPVLLLAQIDGVGGHAITLVGYSLRPAKMLPQEVAAGHSSIPLRGLRIDKFYGHDDQFGPFGRIEIGPGAQYAGRLDCPVTFRGTWTNQAGVQLNLYPEVIVVPVYHKIRLTFLDVVQWLTRLNSLLDAILTGPTPKPDVEWDAHLITTNDFKERLKGSGLGKDRLEKLLLLQHPRFIWYVGLSLNGTLALDLLIDATDMARSFPIYKAIWRDAGLYAAFDAALNAPANQAILASVLTPRFVDFLKRADPA